MHHQGVLEALQAVDFNIVKTRKEVEEVLSKYISDFGTKQFLLKNIFWIDETEMAWRFNFTCTKSKQWKFYNLLYNC